jgi:hypothetical protein
MAVYVVYNDGAEGYAYEWNAAGDSWANIRGGAGNNVSNSFARIDIYTDTDVDEYKGIGRGIMVFDTSALPPGANITAAVLTLTPSAINIDASFTGEKVSLVSSSPAAPTWYENGDYDSLDATILAPDEAIGGMVVGTPFDYTFNAAGRAAISDSGYTNLGFRALSDKDNNPYAWATGENVYVDFYSDNDAGDEPYLTITYDAGNYTLVVQDAELGLEADNLDVTQDSLLVVPDAELVLEAETPAVRNTNTASFNAKKGTLYAIETEPVSLLPEDGATFAKDALRASITTIDHGARSSIEALTASLSASGSVKWDNAFNVSAKRATLTLTDLIGSLGSFGVSAKLGTISISGFDSTSGSFAKDAIQARLVVTGFAGTVDTYECIVMCLDNAANSDYDNFKFDSFAPYGSEVIGANSDGIYLLTGSDDAGTDIDMVLETLQDDFGMGELKSVTDIYVTYKGGPITARAVNEDDERATTVLELTDDMKTRRTHVGRGIERIFWSAKVINNDGISVDVDRIEIRPYRLSGRT